MKNVCILFTTTLWLISAVSYAQSAEEKAIKTVIDGETNAFYQLKSDKALSYWANVPYASHTYSEKGSGYIRGYTDISKVMKKVLREHPDLARIGHKSHDYMIHVNGNSAWATYITDVVDGTKKHQNYDARYLEKVNGVWKLVSAVSKPAP